ncbi:MAG TPA: cupin domain-containing protein [Bacteroidales bacterium]
MDKIIIEKLSKQEIKDREIASWPTWSKEISRFEYTYVATEECYIVEGAFTVETDEKTYHIEAGDFVTFKINLHCTWDIKSPVRKHYNFP